MINKHALRTVARRINEEVASRSHMKVGEIIDHPDGYKVKVISGRFLDPEYGRVTNWWTWRKVGKNGRLGRVFSGYGW